MNPPARYIWAFFPVAFILVILYDIICSDLYYFPEKNKIGIKVFFRYELINKKIKEK